MKTETTPIVETPMVRVDNDPGVTVAQHRYEYTDDQTGEIRTGTFLKIPFLRTPYNYDMNAASDESGLKCEDKSLTIQSDYESTDINKMLERFGQTGTMPVLDRVPLQSDFTDITDFKTAMDHVIQAQAIFDELPAKTRARFGNDPQEFLEFTSDPNNRDEMERMGLLKPRPEPTPPTAVVIVDKDGKAVTETPAK